MKAGRKLHALARASTYMPKEKTRMVMRAFIMSHFSYCPLIWMFHDRRVNVKINHIHERALRIAYQDRTSSFEELLITDIIQSPFINGICSFLSQKFKEQG